MTRRNAARVAVTVVAFGALSRALWPKATTPEPTAPFPVPVRAATAATSGLEAPRDRAAAEDSADEAPAIEDISVDKPEVCRGEPVTVRVRSRGPFGGVYTLIDGQLGNPAVLTYDVPGERRVLVTVYDRGGRERIDRKEITLRVHACDRRAETLQIDARYFSELGVYSFVAHLGADEAPSRERELRGAALAWDFGDGSREKGGARVEHRYARRAPRSVLETRLVKVEATLDGRLLRGSVAVSEERLYLENRRRGLVTPEVRMTEARLEGRAYTALIEIAHFEPADLTVDEVSVAFVPCQGAGPAKGETVDADAYLSARVLEPGVHAYTLRYPSETVPPGTCLVQLTFDGRAADGEPVYWNAHLKVAAFASDRSRRAAPSDPATREQAKTLERAMALLGRRGRPGAFLTEEELQLLERQGKL